MIGLSSTRFGPPSNLEKLPFAPSRSASCAAGGWSSYATISLHQAPRPSEVDLLDARVKGDEPGHLRTDSPCVSEFWCASGSDMAAVSRGQALALLSETDWITRLMLLPLRHVAVEDGVAHSFAKEGGRRSNPVAVMRPTKL